MPDDKTPLPTLVDEDSPVSTRARSEIARLRARVARRPGRWRARMYRRPPSDDEGAARGRAAATLSRAVTMLAAAA